MKTTHFILLTLASLTGSISVWADEAHPFPEEGKIYVLHRFNDSNSYVYENGNGLFASPRTNTQKQYWKFIPTDKANCYYIQNVTSKRYVQSTKIAESTQVSIGNTPVEFEIKKNTTSGAAPNGYYYICSTDQTIDPSKDGTLGLNYQQATGKVVAYHIRYNRGNSYWDILESDYDYEAPAPIEHSDYCKKLGVYVLPCGEKGKAWLTALNVKNQSNESAHEMNYTASTQPSAYYYMVRSDSAFATKGGTLKLSYETRGMTTDYTVTAYFDWDRDGIFESKHEFMNNASGTTEISVPKDAVTGRSRMRIRITENGMDGAEEDVMGMVYDNFMFVSEKQVSTAIAQVQDSHSSQSDAEKQRAYGIDGRQTNPQHHKGIYIQARQKRIK